MNSLMNPKLLPVYLLFVCQFQLFAEATASESVILWSTVSPSGTYALAHTKMISTSSDSDKAAANGKPATELSIVNLQTKEPVLDFSGFGERISRRWTLSMFLQLTGSAPGPPKRIISWWLTLWTHWHVSKSICPTGMSPTLD
jgi:hypothetical protein